MPETSPSTKPPLLTPVKLLAMSGEVGLILAVPLVILLAIGVKIDKALETTPLFMMLGLLASLASSSYIIWRKIRALQ